MKKVFLIVLCVMYSQLACAQEGRRYFSGDNWSVGARVGVVNSLAENISGFTSHILPSYGIEVGKTLSKAIQLRANATWNRQAGEASDGCKQLNPMVDAYRFKALYIGADVMLDVLNVVGKFNDQRKFHILPTLGVGIVKSSNFSRGLENWYIYPVETKNRISPVARFGLTTQYAFSEACDLSMNALCHTTKNTYNGVKSNASTAQFWELSLGVVVHIRDTYNDYRYRAKGPKDDYWLMLRKHRKRHFK